MRPRAQAFNGNPKSGCRFPSTRPLIFGVGSSKFAAGGKGEISVPVNKMAQAMERAYAREREDFSLIVSLTLSLTYDALVSFTWP